MTASDDRARLIEKAAKAVDAAWQQRAVEGRHDSLASTAVRAALTVFEEARASEVSEDERGALANLIPLGFGAHDGVRNVFDAADRILAAGFRRTTPPEPQAEPTDAQAPAAANAYIHVEPPHGSLLGRDWEKRIRDEGLDERLRPVRDRLAEAEEVIAEVRDYIEEGAGCYAPDIEAMLSAYQGQTASDENRRQS